MYIKSILKLLIASASVILFACTISPIVPNIYASEFSVRTGADSAKGTDQVADLFGNGGVFTTITNTLLFILGAVSVIMIIIGGLRYVISNGDSTAISAAKNTVLYAIIGVIIALLAYAIINFIINSLTVGSGSGGLNTNV